jgi:amidase
MFMKAVLDAKPHLREPILYPIPWQDNISHLNLRNGQPSLKIAVMWDDGVVKPHPPVLRALREVTDRLKTLPGVTLVDWTPFKHDEAWDILVSADGYEYGS